MPDGISAACKDFLVRHTHTPCLCSTRHHSWPLRSPHRVGPVFRQFKCFNKEPRWRFAPTQLLQVRADTEHRQTGRLNPSLPPTAPLDPGPGQAEAEHIWRNALQQRARQR